MKIYKDWLNRNGCHFVEAYSGLFFQYQGCTFFVRNNNDDESYLQLLLPKIDDGINGERKNKALNVLNHINRIVKCLKGTLTDDGEVWLAAEILVAKNSNIDEIFSRLLDILMLGRLEYAKLMN